MAAVKTFSVPDQLLHAQGDLSSGELAILALALIGCKKERDRLYQAEKERVAAEPGTELVKYVDFQITEEDVESGQFRRLFEYSMDDLTAMLSCSRSSIYNVLYPASEKMIGRSKSRTDGRSQFNVLAPIYEAELNDGKFMLRIAEKAVIPFNNYAEGFSIVDLEIWARLRKKGARRLYMLICKHRERHSPLKLSLDKIREMLEISEDRYKRNADLNKKLIEPALAEIVEKSVSSVSGEKVWMASDDKGRGFTTCRTGRAVTHIEIQLKWNNPNKQKQAHKDYQALTEQLDQPLNDPTVAIARIGYNKLLAYPHAGELTPGEATIMGLVIDGKIAVPDLNVDTMLKQKYAKAVAKVAGN